MAEVNRIELNPKVMSGRPVIRGTRITVELILRKRGEGATEADLMDALRVLPGRISGGRSPMLPTPSPTKRRCP